MPTKFYTIGQVATLVETPAWKLAYLLGREDIPAPSVVVPGRRLFTARDVEMIRDALRRRGARNDVRGRRLALPETAQLERDQPASPSPSDHSPRRSTSL